VSCPVLLDAALNSHFWSGPEEAARQAVLEAADTGGIVLRVKSLRVEVGAVVVIGLIPSATLVIRTPSEFVGGYLHPRSVGRLHLTWGALLHPETTDYIGYLVLQAPILLSGNIQAEDDDSCWVALALERAHHTLPPGTIGPVCCTRCNRPISQQRLKVIHQARLCTVCQQIMEER
jgi:hypothetical protein